jgi:putative salt-induced outer membrane protein
MLPIRKILIVAVASLLPISTAGADSIWGEFDKLGLENVPVTEDENRFAGRVQLGYMASRGNATTTNLNSKLLLSLEQYNWRHAWVAAGIYTRDETSVIAENYRAGYKADRKLDDQNYLFGALSWEQNEFSGYRQRLTQAIGYGRRVLETDRQRLDLELGVGARQSKLVNEPNEQEKIVRTALSYFIQIAENSDFSQQLAVESGDFNTYIESQTSVSAQLVGQLDLVASYNARRNSRVPEGREKLDTYTTVSVRYNF